MRALGLQEVCGSAESVKLADIEEPKIGLQHSAYGEGGAMFQIEVYDGECVRFFIHQGEEGLRYDMNARKGIHGEFTSVYALA